MSSELIATTGLPKTAIAATGQAASSARRVSASTSPEPSTVSR
ncbi:hypothetical protein ACTTAM_06965 [Rhodobacter capsulatus]